MSDYIRESERSVKCGCPGCVMAYGRGGEVDPDCETCKGTGLIEFGIVERVRRVQ